LALEVAEEEPRPLVRQRTEADAESGNHHHLGTLGARMEPSARNNSIECPWCGGSSLERVHRRFVDRLISLAWPQHRYRCHSLGCEWQGNRSAKGLQSPGVMPQQPARPDRPTVSKESAPRPADPVLTSPTSTPFDRLRRPRECLNFIHHPDPATAPAKCSNGGPYVRHRTDGARLRG